jgi:hypothetical protein
MLVRHVLSLLAVSVLPAALAAQTPASVQRAVQSITPDDVRRRIAIIADDSMRGRDTPSPELDETAAYIAGEFRRLGLKPGGDSGTFLQRYPIDRVQFAPESSTAKVGDLTLAYGTDFVFGDNTFSSGEYGGDLVILSGPLSGELTADTTAFAGKALVMLTSPRNRGERQRVLAWRPAVIVLPVSTSDTAWAQRVSRLAAPQLRDPSRPVGPPVVIGMRTGSLQPILARFGGAADLTTAQTATTFESKTLSGRLQVRARIRTVERQWAPNVVGILEGSDPRLKNEYVVYSAHMDHVGIGRPVGGDSVYNGADDDASGTIAVVEAAEAFAMLRPRPKRSIVFLTVSGEEKGLWGSAYFADHTPMPTSSIVANLNIDMVGRNWRDTIVAIGKEHSDLGATLNRVAAAHPELNMRAIDDIWPQENFYFRSDHYNFARKGVPILFFFSGTHADYHRPGDSVDKIDTEKSARIVKLVFYLGLEVANAAERPKWNPDSFKRIVTGND